MNSLPTQIPEVLRSQAVFLPGAREGAAAWPREEALAVVESLKGTTVPVVEIVLFAPVMRGFMLTGLPWSTERRRNEADADFARRSRAGAAAFINGCERDDATLFSLTFPVRKDAA